MQLVIGSIVRAHGVRGEVVVAVTTDEPQDRYVVGSVLETDPATAGPLTIEGLRVHTSSGVDRLLVAFEGIEDRDAAERLRGVKLLIDADDIEPSDDPDEFHDFQLIGLAVHVGEAPAAGAKTAAGASAGRAPAAAEGERIGEIVRVDHGPGADMLVVARPDGRQTLVPFVTAIVPTVDIAAGRVVITPPDGLLDL
ncbi:MAG TPA: ribosome maturation factor RimM [Micromonosporaceae bacterium]|nr:ribosome maturation factor RimM [Micromonosporaceae bacterium]